MIIRFPNLSDEAQLRVADLELDSDGANFLLDGYVPEDVFVDYIQRVNNSSRGIEILPGRVPSTFWIGEVGQDIVGRVSVRHELNDWLLKYGGHIGYAVRPAFRRMGYAKQLFSAGLKFCGELGIDQALLTCNDNNEGSIRIIEGSGGLLENIVQDGERLVRRYWVQTPKILTLDSVDH